MVYIGLRLPNDRNLIRDRLKVALVRNIYLSHSWINIPSISYPFIQQLFIECLQCASYCYQWRDSLLSNQMNYQIFTVFDTGCVCAHTCVHTYACVCVCLDYFKLLCILWFNWFQSSILLLVFKVSSALKDTFNVPLALGSNMNANCKKKNHKTLTVKNGIDSWNIAPGKQKLLEVDI